LMKRTGFVILIRHQHQLTIFCSNVAANTPEYLISTDFNRSPSNQKAERYRNERTILDEWCAIHGCAANTSSWCRLLSLVLCCLLPCLYRYMCLMVLFASGAQMLF
jgi:hypothetical protein